MSGNTPSTISNHLMHSHQLPLNQNLLSEIQQRIIQFEVKSFKRVTTQGRGSLHCCYFELRWTLQQARHGMCIFFSSNRNSLWSSTSIFCYIHFVYFLSSFDCARFITTFHSYLMISSRVFSHFTLFLVVFVYALLFLFFAELLNLENE